MATSSLEKELNILIKFIKKIISNPNPNSKSIFDQVILEIENYIDGAVAHNMFELKDKANEKKKKGNLFESFCYLYYEKIMGHQVWFYKDFPPDLKTRFNIPSQDYGIDLISCAGGQNYYAIQCKYKKPKDSVQLISWRSLSTFYAIVVKTGPWTKHVTMTNVNGCKHIGKKTEKDVSICIQTFRNLSKFDWLKMINDQGVAVADPVVADPVIANPAVANPVVDNPAVANPAVANPSIEEMRIKRCEKFLKV